jgi:hypothetical protein
MASLRSMIIDGRIARPRRGPPEMQARYQIRAENTERALKSHDTVLVEITSVANDIQEAHEEMTDAEWTKIADFKTIACPMPPFRQMWLEAKRDTLMHVGFLVERVQSAGVVPAVLKEVPPDVREATKTSVNVLVWLNLTGNPMYLGQFMYLLDAEENMLACADTCLGDEDKDENGDNERFKNGFRTTILWMLHALSRMNCHNVKLVPMAAGAPKLKPGSKRPPFSVWHEIVVTSLPQLRREQGETAADGEKREVRYHRVRGHEADYRKGKGLFGRLKVRIWVEEHAAGKPELGTVKAGYKLVGSK